MMTETEARAMADRLMDEGYVSQHGWSVRYGADSASGPDTLAEDITLIRVTGSEAQMATITIYRGGHATVKTSTQQLRVQRRIIG